MNQPWGYVTHQFGYIVVPSNSNTNLDVAVEVFCRNAWHLQSVDLKSRRLFPIIWVSLNQSFEWPLECDWSFLLLLLLLSHFSRVWLCATPETAAHHYKEAILLLSCILWPAYKFPAYFPACGHQACPARFHNHVSQFLGKKICVCMKAKTTQSCLTLCDPMDYTVHWILQARMLNLVAIPFSRGSSQPRDQAQVSHIAGGFFTSWGPREAQEYWSR